jgi:hypothetical protein
LASGYPLLLDAKQKRQGEGILESLDSREKSPADPFPPLGWFAKEIRERERGMARARVAWPKFKFKFESD